MYRVLYDCITIVYNGYPVMANTVRARRQDHPGGPVHLRGGDPARGERHLRLLRRDQAHILQEHAEVWMGLREARGRGTMLHTGPLHHEGVGYPEQPGHHPGGDHRDGREEAGHRLLHRDGHGHAGPHQHPAPHPPPIQVPPAGRMHHHRHHGHPLAQT